MTYTPTTDIELVRTIMTHVKVWPYISDDGSVSPELFVPVMGDSICYLLANDGDNLLGLWMFVQTNSVTLEVHTCLLPGHGFHRGRIAARGAAKWIWENTTAQRIFTHVPACNRIALRFAEASGMKQFGVNPQSFMKDGRLYDQFLLGISRPKESNMNSNKAVA